MAKFFLSFLILLAALTLQFFAASFGYSFDLAFASLIAFAFIFEWRELAPLVLLGTLVLNWQPGISPAILVYLLFPFLAYAAHRFFPWESWIGIAFAGAIGAVALAFFAGTGLGDIGVLTIAADAIAMIIFGLLFIFIVNPGGCFIIFFAEDFEIGSVLF